MSEIVAQALARRGPVTFHTRSTVASVLWGLAFTALMGWVALSVTLKFVAGYRPGTLPLSNWNDALGWAVLGLGFFFLLSVVGILATVTALAVLRRRKPPALRLNDEGLTGYILFARTTLSWREITSLRHRNGWLKIAAGRRLMLVNDAAIWLEGEPGMRPLIGFIQEMRPDLEVRS